MRWSGIAGTGRRGTRMGLNNSLLKMKRDKAPRGRGALFHICWLVVASCAHEFLSLLRWFESEPSVLA